MLAKALVVPQIISVLPGAVRGGVACQLAGTPDQSEEDNHACCLLHLLHAAASTVRSALAELLLLCELGLERPLSQGVGGNICLPHVRHSML